MLWSFGRLFSFHLWFHSSLTVWGIIKRSRYNTCPWGALFFSSAGQKAGGQTFACFCSCSDGQDNSCLKMWSFLKAERKRCRMCSTIPSGRACPIVAMDNALHCMFCLQKKKLLCFPALTSLECELALHSTGCKQNICECKIASAFQKWS